MVHTLHTHQFVITLYSLTPTGTFGGGSDPSEHKQAQTDIRTNGAHTLTGTSFSGERDPTATNPNKRTHVQSTIQLNTQRNITPCWLAVQVVVYALHTHQLVSTLCSLTPSGTFGGGSDPQHIRTPQTLLNKAQADAPCWLACCPSRGSRASHASARYRSRPPHRHPWRTASTVTRRRPARARAHGTTGMVRFRRVMRERVTEREREGDESEQSHSRT